MRDIFLKIRRLFFRPAAPAEIRRKYGMPDAVTLSIERTDGGWFVATSPELPGFVTQARNDGELLEMVNDAMLTYFDVPWRDAGIVYDRLGESGTPPRRMELKAA